MAKRELREFVRQDAGKFGLVAEPDQQPGIDPHRAIGCHRRVEVGLTDDVDAYRAAPVVAHRLTQNTAEIGFEPVVLDDELRLAQAALLLVEILPQPFLIDALRLIRTGIGRQGGLALGSCRRRRERKQRRGKQASDHLAATGVVACGGAPGKSSSSCPTRLVAPTGSRTSPPIAPSALIQTRSPVFRSTRPA